jgi:two-component system, cell cycle sensor histidine kinase and response regulator CckA
MTTAHTALSTERAMTLSRMTPSLIHDLNNLLFVLQASVELIDMEAPGLDGITRPMLQAIDAASMLNRELLAWTHRGEQIEPQPVDVSAAVAEFQAVIETLAGRGISISYGLEPSGCIVNIGRGPLDQILLNLITNARDALLGRGNIRVTTRTLSEPDGSRLVVLEVTDDGPGMTADVQTRIFERFFTTKAQGNSGGFGLETVHAIVQRAGGRIVVESEPGMGATFRLVLPALASAQVIAA